MLTQPYHRPAHEGSGPPAEGVAYHVLVSSVTYWRQMNEDADAIDEGEEQHFGEHRVAQPERRSDRRLELWHRALGDQFAFQELLREGTHAAMHGKLGNDQQGHDHQESGMNLHILQEGDGRARRPTGALPGH